MESKLRSSLSAFLNGDVSAVMQCVHDTFAQYLHTSDFGVRGGLTEASLKVSLLSVLHMLLMAAGLLGNDKVAVQSELYLSDLARRRFADVAVQSPYGTVLIELKYVPPRYRQGQTVPCFSRAQLQKAVADCAALSATDFLKQRVTTGAKAVDGTGNGNGGLVVLSIGELLQQAQQQVNEYAALLYKTQPSCRMKPIHCVAVVALGGRLTWTNTPFTVGSGGTATGSSAAADGVGSATAAAPTAAVASVAAGAAAAAAPVQAPSTTSTTATPTATATRPSVATAAATPTRRDGMQVDSV